MSEQKKRKKTRSRAVETRLPDAPTKQQTAGEPGAQQTEFSMAEPGGRKRAELGVKEWRRISYLLAVLLIFSVSYTASTLLQIRFGSQGVPTTSVRASASAINLSAVAKTVVRQQGFVLPAKWGAAVQQLVANNALNASFLTEVFAAHNVPLAPTEKEVLNGSYEGNVTLNQSNAVFTTLVLWSLGINNNNTILNNGPIMNSSINGGNPYGFASTGGYGQLGSLQLGKLNILSLTPEQQAIADYVALNAYRPCCNNPTAFPDCNHGAAALGLIELMASQGASEQKIFSALEHFNSIQFPQQYVYIAAYFASKGMNWTSVDPSVILSANYSSASGNARIAQYLQASGVVPMQAASSSSCGA